MSAKPVTFFPPKDQKQKKAKENPISFRPPPDLEEYLLELKRRGYGATEVIVRLMRMARDAEAELAAEAPRLEEISRSEGVSPGRVLGKLAKAALSEKKKR